MTRGTDGVFSSGIGHWVVLYLLEDIKSVCNPSIDLCSPLPLPLFTCKPPICSPIFYMLSKSLFCLCGFFRPVMAYFYHYKSKSVLYLQATEKSCGFTWGILSMLLIHVSTKSPLILNLMINKKRCTIVRSKLGMGAVWSGWHAWGPIDFFYST